MAVIHTWKKYNVNTTTSDGWKWDTANGKTVMTPTRDTAKIQYVARYINTSDFVVTYKNGAISNISLNVGDTYLKTVTAKEYCEQKIIQSYPYVKFLNPSSDWDDTWFSYSFTPDPNRFYMLKSSGLANAPYETYANFDVYEPVYSPVYSYSQGTYVEDITSENESAYPKNGKQGDYWYVYQGSVNNFPIGIQGSVRVKDVQKTLTGEGLVKVKGVWRPIVETLMCVKGVWKSMKPTSRLPDGYTEVEYIQSSGAQYIDTGYKPNNKTRIVMDCDIISSDRYPTAFGAWNSSSGNDSSFIYVFTSATGGFYYYGSGYVSVSAGNLYGRHIIDANANKLYLDGANIASASAQTFNCSYNMYLSAFNDVGKVNNNTSMKIYSCQIYDNGTLIRDFVPCKNSSGAVGLYDLVNNKFYANNGSGSFTAGPNVA